MCICQNNHTFFTRRIFGPIYPSFFFGRRLLVTMAAPPPVPEHATGVEWLFFAGMRHEQRRDTAEAAGVSLPPRPAPYKEARARVHRVTPTEPKDADLAGKKASDLRLLRTVNAKPTTFAPARMVRFICGRPCVASFEMLPCGVVHGFLTHRESLPPPISVGLAVWFVTGPLCQWVASWAVPGEHLKFLVISHELASVKVSTTHIAKMLYPAAVYVIQGRSAKAMPQCPTNQCLFFTWKDIGEPSDLGSCFRILPHPLPSGPRQESLPPRLRTPTGSAQSRPNFEMEHPPPLDVYQ